MILRDAFQAAEPLYLRKTRLGGAKENGEQCPGFQDQVGPLPSMPSMLPCQPPAATALHPDFTGVQFQSLIPSLQPLDLFILIQLHTQYEICKQKITHCNN